MLRQAAVDRLTARRVLLFCLVLAGCGGGGAASEGDDVEDGTAAQNGTLPDEIGTFKHQGPTPVIVLGRQTYALVGERIGELQDGKRYKFGLAREEGEIDGLTKRKLVDFRKVQKLVGTLSDDVQDPALVHLKSMRDRGYVLTGDSVAMFKETRAGLPSHDYTKTLFRINAVIERGTTSRYEWIDYEPVPLYRCAQNSAPHVHLDLVNVRPDDSLLDGFVATELGHDAQLGPHAECRKDGQTAYACALDDLSGPWGTSRFVPAGASFELVVERSDTAHTRVAFACTPADRAALTNESED